MDHIAISVMVICDWCGYKRSQKVPVLFVVLFVIVNSYLSKYPTNHNVIAVTLSAFFDRPHFGSGFNSNKINKLN